MRRATMSTEKIGKQGAMEEDPNDSDGSSDNSDDTDVYDCNEEVQIEFEGRAPIDPDCHGILQLLQCLFLRAPINCMQMANLIISQNYVGSVICQCEPDDPESDDDEDMVEDGTIFGITTVLNITAKREQVSITQLRAYILEKAEKYAPNAVNVHFRDILGNEAQHVGFLINERFINIPAKISLPLLENLQKEIQAAKAKNMQFNFAHLLMIVKVYRKEAKKGKPAVYTYTNVEEELIVERATHQFEYSVANETDTLAGDTKLTPYRKILLIDGKKLPQLINEIKNCILES